ncbi:MAG: hypothetical protein KKF56_02855 [Nanoarchaeota archaeon]|nr:hypothetical protein [Nanoarchaeota archaeon]
MNRLIMINIIFGILLVGVLGIVMGAYNNTTETIRIPIEKGWNLIPLSSGELSKKVDSPIEISDFKYIFLYDYGDEEYKLIQEDGEEVTPPGGVHGGWIEDNDMKYYLGGSVWAYSENPGDMMLSWRGINSLYKDYSNWEMVRGWNFMHVVPNMVSKQLSEIKGSCDIEKIAVWQHQDWTVVSPSTLGDHQDTAGLSWDELVIADTNLDVGLGMIIKVSSDCRLGSSGDGGSNPPSLP